MPSTAVERRQEQYRNRSKYTEPFHLDLTNQRDVAFPQYQQHDLVYDLVAAAQRQRSFFYQVSLPHYQLKSFLLSSINRYRMFHALKKRNPAAFLVPCYDIDLAWHTHQLHHRIYREDTIGYLGKMFNHDDTVTDRRPDSKLTQADKISRELWKAHFGTHFATCGCHVSRRTTLWGFSSDQRTPSGHLDAL